MKPVIGITCPWSLETWGVGEQGRTYDYAGRDYSAAIYRAGGIPLLIPAIADEADLQAHAERILRSVDGLYFTGGGDRKANAKIAEIPTLYNQQPVRSRWEDTLLKLAYDRDVPCLGVCRGYQMMAAAFGGAMDPVRFPAHRQTVPADQGIHNILPVPGTQLAGIVGEAPWFVNSLHVERIGVMPEGFVVSARAEDGSIEAIEAADRSFFMGTQFHPELMPNDPRGRKILLRLTAAAAR